MSQGSDSICCTLKREFEEESGLKEGSVGEVGPAGINGGWW